jgi:hypothetical protein
VLHVRERLGLHLVEESRFVCHVVFLAGALGGRGEVGGLLEPKGSLVVYLAPADHGPFCHTYIQLAFRSERNVESTYHF